MFKTGILSSETFGLIFSGPLEPLFWWGIGREGVPGFEGDLPLSPGTALDGFPCVEPSSQPPGWSDGQMTGWFYVSRSLLIEPLGLCEETPYTKERPGVMILGCWDSES